MRRRRGMSAEEKQRAILKIFHDNQDVFNYKEIEKLSKKKGISKERLYIFKEKILEL
jgi:hypothetical protein